MRVAVAAMVAAFGILLAGCGGSPSASPADPTSQPPQGDAPSLVARLATDANRVRTDLEAIHYLNAAMTAAPGTDKAGSAALFGELVDMFRNRFGNDVESFARSLGKAATPDQRKDFAGSLADLRKLETLGKVVTAVATPTAEQVQAFFDGVASATTEWNRDVA